MSSIYIRNALIINEGYSRKGDLLIEDEIITAIGEIPDSRIPRGVHKIEAEGLLLLPGIIDDQVHFREPGLTHKGDIYSE